MGYKGKRPAGWLRPPRKKVDSGPAKDRDANCMGIAVSFLF